MPISPQQQYTDYGLLVPRSTVRFRDVSDFSGVRVEPVNSETKVKPLVITSGENYDFEGVASGGRSGLWSFDGLDYKIKGCRIERAFETEGLYRIHHLFHDVEGGQLLSDAENDIKCTSDINDILTRAGFTVAYEPEAIIHYGKTFKPPVVGNNFSKILRSLVWRNPDMLFESLNQEELVASVTRIKGDTRFTCLYSGKIQDEETATAIAYRFGLMAGAQKRVTEDFYWHYDSNHIGNYVIFTEDNQLHLTMVDFEDTVKYQDLRFKFLNNRRRNSEIRGILKSADRPTPAMQFHYCVQSIPKEKMGRNAPPYFREAFKRGFMDGYKNPDKRESITLEMLVEAFDLGDIDY